MNKHMNIKSGYTDRSLISYDMGPSTEGESTCYYSFNDGSKWWKNPKGQLHRIHGPAVELGSGTQEYWLGGIQVRSKFIKRIMKQRSTNRKFAGG